jgi:hypothetical protein
MTNKLGTVKSVIHCKNRIIYGSKGYICDLPEDRQDAQDGMIAYLDRSGMLQFMDGDPND